MHVDDRLSIQHPDKHLIFYRHCVRTVVPDVEVVKVVLSDAVLVKQFVAKRIPIQSL